MAIISEKSFVNGVLKNQSKKTQHPQTAIVNEADFLSRGADEMSRRKTAYENYKKAVEEQRQIWQKSQERRATQAYAARADARQDMAAAYGQAGAGTAAKRTAYENYAYALRQQELWQKKMRGGTLTPAEEMILNRNVYKSPEKAQQREANQQTNDNLQWAQERRQKREAQLSEQEFNRSPAMQEQWGNYSNYVRGVYAGYDEAVAKREQEQAKTSKEWQADSDALQAEMDKITGQLAAAYRNPSAENYQSIITMQRQWNELNRQKKETDKHVEEKQIAEKRAAKQEAQRAAQEQYAGWTEEQMQSRLDELNSEINSRLAKSGETADVSTLKQERAALQGEKSRVYPNTLQKVARFAEDAATAFYDAGVAQSMSGFEMARNVAETKVNQGAAWALRDLANAQILKLPGGEKYAEKLRTLADRLSTSYDYTDAQQWNDYYQRIMNEAMQDHSVVGTWIIQQLPSAGAMVNDLMISTASGNALTPLSVMGVRAGGSAMLDAHNEGATDTQALLIGLENAAVEVLSEKLFGGNPVYDEDVGLVNRAVAKLTKSKSVMKVLDSKAFDFVSEGLEEVIAELLEPTFQGLVLNGSLKGTVSWESLGNSFLGGIFLAALGDLAGLPAGLTQAKQERQTKQYAQILAETGAKSDSAEVREAAAILQEKLDYGRTPDIEDIGRTLSAMDDAGQTEAAQEAAETAKQSRAYNQYEQAVEDVQRSQAQYERDTERQRIFQAERDGTITHEQAEAALDSLDQDEAINREEAQRVAARNVQSEAETAEAVGNARARQQSQQAQNEAELERQGAARDDTAIRSAAKQYGWGEQLTGAAAQSYAAYNRGGQGAMSAAEYAAAVNEVRQQGADGIRLDAVQRGAQGLPRTIVQTAWEAGRKAGQQNSAAQYSIAKDYGKKLRQWNRDGRPGGASFALGTTGATLQGLGAVESDIYMNGDKISTILKEHPEISMKEVEKIPEILEDPVLILKSKSGRGDNSRLVLFGSVKAQNGQPVMAVLDLRATEGGFLLDDMQKVNSAYTKKNPASFIQSSEVLYADEKRTIPLLRRTGLTIASQRLLRNGSVGSISYNGNNVNMKGVPFSEMVQTERQGGSNGTTVSDDGGKRNAGVDSGKQTGGVAKGAGRAEAQQGNRSWREEGRELEDRVRAAKQTGKSAKEIGIRNGSAEKSFYEVPRELWTPSLQKVADYARKNAVKDVHFFVGKIGVVNQRANVTRYMNGVMIDGNSIWIRVNDNRISPEQIARHEIFHSMAERAPNMLEAVQEQITKRLGKEKIQTLAQRYAEAYEGCYTEAEIEHYLEEICADAYAGIERFSGLSREAMDALRSADGKTQSQKKADSARAPPERYSMIGRGENGLKTYKSDFTSDMTAMQKQAYLYQLINSVWAEKPLELTILQDGKERKITARFDGEANGERFAGKMAFGNRRGNRTERLVTLNLANDIWEIASESRYDGEKGGYKQTARHDGTEQWHYFVNEINYADAEHPARDGVYDFNLDVMEREDGNFVYTFSLKKRRTDAPQTFTAGVDSKNATDVDPSENSIRKDGENVKQKYSASEEAAGTAEQEKKGYTLETIPKKAQTYLRKAQNDLLYQLERSIRMPLGRNARSVRGLLDNLTNEYLQTGAVTQETMDKSFEAVYAEGMRLEKEFYEKIRTLAPKLKRMEITPTAEEWAALDNPDAFRKRVKGTLNIVDSGGKSVNEVYEAMSKAAPEVFPRGVTGAAEQELMLLMGARRMQLAEANTEGYDGKNAAIWKRAAKSDFEAGVKDLMGDLNVARRYAESKQKTEKAYQGPQTAEEAMELYHELADQKRNYERVAADYLLTAEDRRTVGRLLRGDITPESVRGMENADAILAVYEAKADYELTALKIEEYKRHIGEARVKQARAALGDVSKYKDKRWGLQYARETQQRNIRDIAPAENAEAINRQYFNPVRKATADATRLKNQMRERVAALDLSRHRKRGNALSESAAVQILGEAQDNVRVLENSRGRLQDRDGKTLDEWQGIISQLWQGNPNLDRAKIENAVKEFHSIYDELYKMMNETRVRNGYAPVNYRAGYFPHFGVGTSDGILNLMGMGMGIDAGIETLPNDAKGIIRWFLKTRKEERGPDALPTEINGRTKSFRPGITWFANAQERNGFRTAYDAVLGFDKYIEGAASVIYYTDAIQNLRTLASQVRYLSANDGLREQEDAIRARQDMTEGQKQLAIDDLKKNGKYALSLWVANLDEYTNLLANKKSTLDRDAESLVNRSVHSFLKKWQSRVAANMVALNPGSWLTNFGVIAQAGAEMKVSSVLKAMQQQAMSHWTQDGFSERSDFLTSRAGSDTLTAGWVDNASKVLSMPMEWIDTYSANVIVRARYMENLQRGMSEEAAMEEADDFAANVMADRSKGAMPTLFESRNPLFKMFTQFQLEVNNTFSYVFKDLPAEQRKKGIGALALALFKFCLQSWLYNELYESLIGRRPMLDPIDLAMEGAAGYAGYERNNAIRAALSGQKWFEKKDEDEHWLNTTISLAGELGQELPFIGNLLGGGKLPYMSTFPDLGNVVSTITSEEWTAEQKRAKIWKELKDPVMYWVPPFGGGQIKKTTEAITAAKRGGSYAADGTLQYPIYDETAGDKVQKWVTNLVFGKSSTKAAQEWVESGFKNLSRKETAAYQAMIQTDAGQRESYTFVTAMKNVKEKEAKLSMLFAYDLPESGKAAYYYEAIAEDSERERMDALREKGISNEEYVAFKQAYFAEYGTQAVSQERMNMVLDKLNLPKNKKAEIWRSCGKDWKEENNPYK